MSYTYTVSRFDPTGVDPSFPIQTRRVSADSEDEAVDMMSDVGDGSYWEVIDTNDPSVIRLNGGRA